MRRENSEQNILEGGMAVPIDRSDENQATDTMLLLEYEHFLSGKTEGTIEAYLRTVRQR